MTKMNYAEAIAVAVKGTVNVVDKANGIIKCGISRKSEGSNVAPTIYIDSMYESETPLEEATREVERLLVTNAREHVDLDYVKDFDKVKGLLRARLYNKATKAEVKVSAKKYGYDDLIIVPYIDGVIENGSIKVNKALLETWKVTKRHVMELALSNTAKEIDIMSFASFFDRAGGILPVEMSEAKESIITRKMGCFGAIGVICKADELAEMYPQGYTVLPSSIHECIVTPLGDGGALTEMVQAVNAECVGAEDFLSDHAYEISE